MLDQYILYYDCVCISVTGISTLNFQFPLLSNRFAWLLWKSFRWDW